MYTAPVRRGLSLISFGKPLPCTQASLPQYMHIVHANANPGQRRSGGLIRHAFVCS